MPFDTVTLSAAIKAKLLDLRTNTDDADAAAQELADTISQQVGIQLNAMFADLVILHVPALVSPSGPVTGTIVTTITPTIV